MNTTTHSTKKKHAAPKSAKRTKSANSAVLLGEFIKNHKPTALTLAEFGDMIGCTKSHVCGMVNGDTTPGLTLALKIQEVTKGYVPVDGWRKRTRKAA